MIQSSFHSKQNHLVELVTDLDVEYKMRTRAIGVYFDGDLAVPDGVKRTLTVKAAAGDDVEKVTRTFVELINSMAITQVLLGNLVIHVLRQLIVK